MFEAHPLALVGFWTPDHLQLSEFKKKKRSQTGPLSDEIME